MSLQFWTTFASVTTLGGSVSDTCADNTLKSPDLSRPFGDPITVDEVKEYDRWYNSLVPGQDRWPDLLPSQADSSALWYDNRQEYWSWQGNYMMSGLLNMWRMTGQTCRPDPTASIASTASTPSVVGYFEEMERSIDFMFEMTDFRRKMSGDVNAQMDYIQERYLNSWAQNTSTCGDCDEFESCDTCPDGLCPLDDSLDTCGEVYCANMVQTFMLLDPIAELCYTILKSAPDDNINSNDDDDDSSSDIFNANNVYCCADNNKNKTVFEKASEWVELAIETIDDYFYPFDLAGSEVNVSWIGIIEPYGWTIRNPHSQRFVQLGNLWNKSDLKNGQLVATNRMAVAATVLSHILGVKDSIYLSEDTVKKIEEREEMWLKLIENVFREWNDDKIFYGEDNAYVNWSYAIPDYDTRRDDTGHAGIEMRAYTRLHELNMTQSIDWDQDEPFIQTLNKFARTFSQVFTIGDGTMTNYVTGEGVCDKRTPKGGRYSVLNPFRMCDDDVSSDNSCTDNEVWERVKIFYNHSYSTDEKGFGFTNYIYIRGGCHGQPGCKYPLQYVTGKSMDLSDVDDSAELVCQDNDNPPETCITAADKWTLFKNINKLISNVRNKRESV